VASKLLLQRLSSLGFKSYQGYLNSKLWDDNKRRLRLPKRCWVCGRTWSLHAHHASYERLGAEQPGDIIVLCAPHHRGVHNFKTLYRLQLEEAHVVYKRFYESGERPARKARKRRRRRK
jgi:hypothetical protein